MEDTLERVHTQRGEVVQGEGVIRQKRSRAHDWGRGVNLSRKLSITTYWMNVSVLRKL